MRPTSRSESFGARSDGITVNGTGRLEASMPEPTRNRRLSLTKRQRADGPGAELLTMLELFLDDGALSDKEIATLDGWLRRHRAADLPAVAYLAETVERVL